MIEDIEDLHSCIGLTRTRGTHNHCQARLDTRKDCSNLKEDNIYKRSVVLRKSIAHEIHLSKATKNNYGKIEKDVCIRTCMGVNLTEFCLG